MLKLIINKSRLKDNYSPNYTLNYQGYIWNLNYKVIQYTSMKDVLKNVNQEFWDLQGTNGECIPPTDCRTEKLYWAKTRSMGSIAICLGADTHGITRFKGLRYKFGSYFIAIETHYDDDHVYGTCKPFVELGDAPNVNDTILMPWLLNIQIETKETFVAWLKAMPEHLKAAESYDNMLAHEEAYLADLKQDQARGFNY